jgi:lipid-A-disaccharide synthase (EC 2.4.1.182)
VSHMLALFPFEEEIYRRNNIPVSYVGHPLADVIPLEVNRPALREKLGIPQDQLVFALLPGSRQSELQYLADTFIETAKCLNQRFPHARFLVPLATRETRDLFELALYRLSAQDLPITRLFGHAQEAMGAADGVLVASGTATLEAALLEKTDGHRLSHVAVVLATHAPHEVSAMGRPAEHPVRAFRRA